MNFVTLSRESMLFCLAWAGSGHRLGLGAEEESRVAQRREGRESSE